MKYTLRNWAWTTLNELERVPSDSISLKDEVEMERQMKWKLIVIPWVPGGAKNNQILL